MSVLIARLLENRSFLPDQPFKLLFQNLLAYLLDDTFVGVEYPAANRILLFVLTLINSGVGNWVGFVLDVGSGGFQIDLNLF